MAEEAAAAAEIWSWCGSAEQHKLLLQIISQPTDAPTAAAALMGGRPLQVRHVHKLALLVSKDRWVQWFKSGLPAAACMDRGGWLHTWLHYLGCREVGASLGARSSSFTKALFSWATREAELAKKRLVNAQRKAGKATEELHASACEEVAREEKAALEIFELPEGLRSKLPSPPARQPIATPDSCSPAHRHASGEAADAASAAPTPPAASEGEAVPGEALVGIDLLAAAAAAELPAAAVEQAVAQRLDEAPTEQCLRAELATARKTSWAVHEVRRQG